MNVLKNGSSDSVDSEPSRATTDESGFDPIRPRPLPQKLSLREHLQDLAARPDTWLVLVRNMVPIIGVYLFKWSASLLLFTYWFDGIVALSAILLAILPRAFKETSTTQERQKQGYIRQGINYIFVWVVLTGILGLPYWIVLIPLHDECLKAFLEIMQSRSLLLTFCFLGVTHFHHAFKKGYSTLQDRELTQILRWDVYLLFARGIALFIFSKFGALLVPLMALVLTYFEVWPERILAGFSGRDSSKLWQDDDGDKLNRSIMTKQERKKAGK